MVVVVEVQAGHHLVSTALVDLAGLAFDVMEASRVGRVVEVRNFLVDRGTFSDKEVVLSVGVLRADVVICIDW